MTEGPNRRTTVLLGTSTRTAFEELRAQVELGGYRTVGASTPAHGLSTLQNESTICLVIVDIHFPVKAAGIAFIREVRRRHPRLPVAAITAHPEDLDELLGTPECPILIITKPIHPPHVRELLRLISGKAPRSIGGEKPLDDRPGQDERGGSAEAAPRSDGEQRHGPGRRAADLLLEQRLELSSVLLEAFGESLAALHRVSVAQHGEESALDPSSPQMPGTAGHADAERSWPHRVYHTIQSYRQRYHA